MSVSTVVGAAGPELRHVEGGTNRSLARFRRGQLRHPWKRELVVGMWRNGLVMWFYLLSETSNGLPVIFRRRVFEYRIRRLFAYHVDRYDDEKARDAREYRRIHHS